MAQQEAGEEAAHTILTGIIEAYRRTHSEGSPEEILLAQHELRKRLEDASTWLRQLQQTETAELA